MAGLSIEHLAANILGIDALGLATLAATGSAPKGLPEHLTPRRLEDFQAPSDLLDREERKALALNLENGLSPFEPHVAVLDSVRKLALRESSIVITTQRPEVLGGTLEVCWKALHCIKLAAALEARWGKPVIPVFWIDSFEGDLAAANRFHLLNAHQDPRRIGLAGMPSGANAASRHHLDGDKQRIGAVEEVLRQQLSTAPFLEETLQGCMPQEGHSLSQAFARTLLNEWGKRGLVVIDPEWLLPDLNHLLSQAILSDPLPALRVGADKMSACGYDPAIDMDKEAICFRIDGSRLHALREGGDGFRYDGEPGSRTKSELAAEIVQSPSEWAPSGLILPALQEGLLPLAARVGSWKEGARSALLANLRTSLGLAPCPFVPRLSASIVDPECQASLARSGQSLKTAFELNTPTNSTGKKSAEKPEPQSELAKQLRLAAGNCSKELNALRADIAEFDRGLAMQLKRTASKIRSDVSRFSTRLERVQANHSGKRQRHRRVLFNNLRPLGSTQETVLAWMPYCAQFGRDWLDQLGLDLDPIPTEHLGLYLSPPEP